MAKKGGCKGGGCKGGKGGKGGCKGFALTGLLFWVVALFGLTFLLGGNFGCNPGTEQIERGKDQVVKEVIAPAVQKITSEVATRNAQLQGQGSLINPGYRIKGFAGFGPMAVWDFEINTTGVSANIAGATQGDQGPDLKKP